MRIFLFPEEDGFCSNKLSNVLLDTFDENRAVGELQVLDHLFGDDYTTIKVPKSAFQGICFPS